MQSVLKSFDFLPSNKFLDQAKFKAFADDKFSAAKIINPVFDRVENIVGIGENAGNQHFLLLPKCFQKAYFSGSFKVGTVWTVPRWCIGKWVKYLDYFVDPFPHNADF